jgi:hypothetical protein
MIMIFRDEQVAKNQKKPNPGTGTAKPGRGLHSGVRDTITIEELVQGFQKRQWQSSTRVAEASCTRSSHPRQIDRVIRLRLHKWEMGG